MCPKKSYAWLRVLDKGRSLREMHALSGTCSLSLWTETIPSTYRERKYYYKNFCR